MKVSSLVAACAVVLLVSSTSSAAIIIGDGLANNNGGMLSDPAGTAAPAAVGLNGETVDSSNGFGRALAFNGGTFSVGDGTDLAQITDNPGVDIAGFNVYRTFYSGGSDAYGFVENGAGAAGGGANVAFNGRAFANSSDYFLLSDDIAVAGAAAGDTFNLDVDEFALAGTATVTAFIYFDNGTGTNLGNIAGTSFSGIAAPGGGYSSVRVGFLVDSPNGDDSALDNVVLEQVPVPEPSSLVIAGFALAGIMTSRRRS